MRMQQFVFIGALFAVLLHFVADGTMPRLLSQLSQLGSSASESLRPIASAF